VSPIPITGGFKGLISNPLTLPELLKGLEVSSIERSVFFSSSSFVKVLNLLGERLVPCGVIASGVDVIASGVDVIASGVDVIASGVDVIASGVDVIASIGVSVLT